MTKLVIFDLDDTLLCADSEFHFTKYIVKQGMLDKDFYLKKIKAFDKDYRSGNLNFNDYMRFLLYPLIGKTKDEVDLLVSSFINSSKDIFFEHLHPSIGKSKIDKFYLEASTKKEYDKGENIFQQLVKKNFNKDNEKELLKRFKSEEDATEKYIAAFVLLTSGFNEKKLTDLLKTNSSIN